MAHQRSIQPDPPPLSDVQNVLMTRRGLLKGSGALVATSAVVTATTGCTASLTGSNTAPTPTPIPVAEQYPAVPPPPATPPSSGELRFFSSEQARTLDALVATMLPGSEDDPGAREAGVVNYIDHLLASQPEGFAQAIYREGPFAEPYQGEQAPEAEGQEVVWVKSDQLPRYGYQSFLTPREIYELGVQQVENLALSRFGQPMAELSPDQQEAVVDAMASGQEQVSASEQQEQSGEASNGGDDQETGFYPPSLQEFFQTVQQHVIEGMFGDPAYGGNRDMVGWKLIGYPGAQRAYTPSDMKTPGIGTRRPPQSLAQLPPFNPGQRLPRIGEENIVLPVSGSEPWSGETKRE